MSRTYRKDKRNHKYPDGRLGEKSPYVCRCFYCTGVDKKALEEKIADKDMKLQLFNALEWNHSMNLDMDDYHEMNAQFTDDAFWWAEYQEKQAA